MGTSVRRILVAVLCLPLAVVGLAGGQPGPQPEPAEPTLPDEAFAEIVREANQYIQKSLDPSERKHPSHRAKVTLTVRANTLLIALAAQNRMGKAGGDVGRLATLRDTAVRLAVAVGEKPGDRDEVLKQAAILNRYPDLRPDPAARPEPVRLTDTFNHDPISILFGGCSGRDGHAIQFTVLALGRQETPYTRDEAKKVELLAYKVALIGGLLRDLEGEFPVRKPQDRGEWARLSGELNRTGWRLAETARGRDSADVRRVLGHLRNTCTTCHEKFLD